MTTKKPAKKGPPFGYGKPTDKKAATSSTPTLKGALTKLDMPSLTKETK
jgi:hypothetical protein